MTKQEAEFIWTIEAIGVDTLSQLQKMRQFITCLDLGFGFPIPPVGEIIKGGIGIRPYHRQVEAWRWVAYMSETCRKGMVPKKY